MAVDAFLEIHDKNGMIKGESLDKDHKDMLQIRNFSFGVEATASPATGTGLGAGKATLKAFSFDVDNSIASPTLYKFCCNGTHCPKAKLHIRKAGGTPQDYYIWTFKDLIITGFELSPGEEIVEKITLTYTALHCEYHQQLADGGVDKKAQEAGYDVKVNREWDGK
jgi:type VI secretion system secreted protein Hcp